MAAPRTIAARGAASVGHRLVALADRLRGPDPGPTLAGDRALEWAWCAGRLPAQAARVLDVGAGSGILSAAAALRGHRVVAVDLEPNAYPFELPDVEFRRGDVNELDFELASFDCILNCSTVEHVGLAGRYGSADDAGADLRAMEKLAGLLAPGGEMALTIPVGRDDVFPPFHRIYGPERLPRLLAAFEVVTEQYWSKRGERWVEVDREAALAEQGSESYYALGLFALRARR